MRSSSRWMQPRTRTRPCNASRHGTRRLWIRHPGLRARRNARGSVGSVPPIRVDLVDGQATRPLDRDAVRRTLNALVPAPEGQPDRGIDAGQPGTRPSGAEEPANPSEVLSRPDPNTAQAPETPTKQASGASLGRDPRGRNADLYAKFRHRRWACFAHSQGTAAALGLPAVAQVALVGSRGGGGTCSAAGGQQRCRRAPAHAQRRYAQHGLCDAVRGPYRTSPSSAPSPSAKTDTTSRADGTDGGSGFLSSWMRSRSKASQSRATRGHTKRQSIRSIEVFQPSDSDDDRDARKFAFPRGAVQTPPRSVRSSSKGERPRVDSTMSLGAPQRVPHAAQQHVFSA
ncbi:hypothetical protein L1887_57957 [Cichorium endivia]|nr:hypothetical protein L1887_57957 [Cichorium endivia]